MRSSLTLIGLIVAACVITLVEYCLDFDRIARWVPILGIDDNRDELQRQASAALRRSYYLQLAITAISGVVAYSSVLGAGVRYKSLDSSMTKIGVALIAEGVVALSYLGHHRRTPEGPGTTEGAEG